MSVFDENGPRKYRDSARCPYNCNHFLTNIQPISNPIGFNFKIVLMEATSQLSPPQVLRLRSHLLRRIEEAPDQIELQLH
jgi:hypothetical protein